MNNTWQTWDNLLSYIKLELGNDIMKIEFDDDRIIEIIKEHVMPVFCSWDNGLHKFYKMTEDMLIQEEPYLLYKFNFEIFPYKIMTIKNIIPQMSFLDMEMFYQQNMSGGDITDYLISSNYIDMSKIAIASDTWRFIPGDKIQVSKANYTCRSREFIVELDVIHPDPTTIEPTVYEYFRDLCYAEISIFLGKLRSKYKNFSTPFGEVLVNADDLIQDGKQLKQETLEKLKQNPPEKFVYFLN